MALPLLNYKPSSQNQRVANYEVPGDEQSRIFSTDNILDATDMDALIEAAYRQMFFYAFKWDREPFLESQLRNGQITVRDFIRGLALSKTFYNSFYEKNSNYKFVEHCVQKILGREVYNEREKIAWSIVVANKGIQGLVDQLLDSEEYLSNFGYSTVPYQRRRILPGRVEGERPIHISNPRYDAYHRTQLGFPQIVWQSQVKRFVPQEKKATAGNPSLFLGMARSISPTSAAPARVSTGDINIATKVPYRKLSQ
ncbi:phycobilisome rod-core linker polypeptide [Pseudanabaena sp. FACHB-2040]|uniref:phycobilisome rod-core linker polypeptide n=1 Tax=Pseudanabaena sp. FACHB-2040 TaxID=2692859 RepID=UPI0016876400|nr:phycobilisome rod-core linker polypeptide [Pseudanabaena sp. FACHB-2040]